MADSLTDEDSWPLDLPADIHSPAKQSSFPTRNNKAGRSANRSKRPRLLVPKATDLPPVLPETTPQESTLFKTLWQQVLKKNNLILVAGVLQLWRARFVISDTARALASKLQFYKATGLQAGKWMLLLIRKREHRQVLVCVAKQKNQQLASITLGMLFSRIYTMLKRLSYHLRHLHPLSFPWDSLILAIIALTIIRYLLNPKTWI